MQIIETPGMDHVDPTVNYPQYGQDYYAVMFADPDGIKLELVHYPWGYWKNRQTGSSSGRSW